MRPEDSFFYNKCCAEEGLHFADFNPKTLGFLLVKAFVLIYGLQVTVCVWLRSFVDTRLDSIPLLILSPSYGDTPAVL